LINSGIQLWGPVDGTSIRSRKINEVFGNRPGRIFVAASGDEGGLPTHAGGMYANVATTVNVVRSKSNSSQLALWFKGPPVSITIRFDDDSRTVTARTDVPSVPALSDIQNGISIFVYKPGEESYPITSTNGDHFVLINLKGHIGVGHIVLQGLTTEVGRFEIYSDADAITSFRDNLVRGRLIDLASTASAIVVGAYVSATSWIDIDGKRRDLKNETPGKLWSHSAGGPTRSGQLGIDLATPGHGIIAVYATNSYWATFRDRMIQGGGGFYGIMGATSGASPITVGAIALMLQVKPDLTTEEARAILHKTATSDRDTGPAPNLDWGFGKINVRRALDELCERYHSQICSNKSKSGSQGSKG
jgi:subtilisin family serine protease